MYAKTLIAIPDSVSMTAIYSSMSLPMNLLLTAHGTPCGLYRKLQCAVGEFPVRLVEYPSSTRSLTLTVLLAKVTA